MSSIIQACSIRVFIIAINIKFRKYMYLISMESITSFRPLCIDYFENLSRKTDKIIKHIKLIIKII